MAAEGAKLGAPHFVFDCSEIETGAYSGRKGSEKRILHLLQKVKKREMKECARERSERKGRERRTKREFEMEDKNEYS